MNFPRRNLSKYCVCARARRTRDFAQTATSRGTMCSKHCVRARAQVLALRTRFRKLLENMRKNISEYCVCARAHAFRRTRAFARTAIKHCVCARARVLALCTSLRKLLENTACAHVRGCFGSPGRGRGARYTVSYGFLRVSACKRV